MKWLRYFWSYKPLQNIYRDKKVFRTFFTGIEFTLLHISITIVDFTNLLEDISSKRVDFYGMLSLKIC